MARAQHVIGAVASWRGDKKRMLMMLLGLVVGLEFLENGMFVFAASYVVGGVDAAPREFAQVQAAYAVGSMLMIVMQQSLSRHFGYRRYLSASLALFMAGALASAASQGLAGLTLARLLQGFGGGALFTSSRILIPMLFTPSERPPAVKVYMLTLFGLSALAPIAAASLVEAWGWRWIFISVLPLAGLTLAGSWILLPDELGRGGKPVRWAAGPLIVVAIALTLVQLALSEARFDVFSHPLQLAAVSAAGVGLLAWFFYQQWHHEEPFMRLRELRHPVYLMGLVLYFVHYLLSNASSYLFPIFAERALGIPLSTAGWLSTLSAGVSFLGAYVYVKFGGKLPSKKPLMTAGALMLAVTAWMFAGLPAGAPVSALSWGLVTKGLFGIMLVLPVAGLTFRALSEDRFAHGYQSKNLMRQIAGSFSTAVTAILLQDRQFANYQQLDSTVGANSPVASSWLANVQAALVAGGLPASQAHGAALGQLARTIDQQSQLLACEDLYRLLAVCCCVAAVFIVMQRQLK